MPRSNVADEKVATELEEALADFRQRGDRTRLAARLRLILISIRVS